MVLGEAFIAFGWIDPLLGLYPVLRDRYIWLVRAGLVFAVIGLIAFVYLTAASVFATLQGMEITDIPIPIAVFLPGIIAGSLLAFVCFSVASLRSDAHSRTLGILMLSPQGFTSRTSSSVPLSGGQDPTPESGFVITGGPAVAM